jgi:hypothetical protein
MSENVGASTSRNPKGLHGLCREIFTLPYPEYGGSRFSQNTYTYLKNYTASYLGRDENLRSHTLFLFLSF